jgi:hypothetical protein
MSQATRQRHPCFCCAPHEVQGPFRQQGHEDAPAWESIETTFAENGDEVFFASGYSAREIAQKHARETGGQVYVNTISRNIKRRELSVPVSYAASRSSVYTLRGPDEWHDKVHRAYWPPL